LIHEGHARYGMHDRLCDLPIILPKLLRPTCKLFSMPMRYTASDSPFVIRVMLAHASAHRSRGWTAGFVNTNYRSYHISQSFVYRLKCASLACSLHRMIPRYADLPANTCSQDKTYPELSFVVLCICVTVCSAGVIHASETWRMSHAHNRLSGPNIIDATFPRYYSSAPSRSASKRLPTRNYDGRIWIQLRHWFTLAKLACLRRNLLDR
jgi:hypothetical protein